MRSFRLVLGPSPEQRVDAMSLRRAVFIEEQQVAESIEQDGRDDEAHHIVVLDDEERVVATGRLMLSSPQTAKIQRVAVLKTLRGLGVGRVAMEGLEELGRLQGATTALLASQIDALGFYTRLGYVAYGEPFYEANILHRWMRKPL